MRKIILSIIVITYLEKNDAVGQYWSAVGEGVGYPEWELVSVEGPTDGYDAPVTGPPVASFCIYNGELYAAGYFDYVNGPAANIAKWNGINWQPVPGIYTAGGGGVDSWVNALLVYNGELYVAGRFTNAGDIETYNIAKWNGNNWSAVGAGLGTYGYSVSSLAIYNGELYAGGHFYNSGGIQVNNIAKWNGSNWSSVGSGIDVYSDPYLQGTVSSLVVHDGELYAGGYFDTTVAGAHNNIVKWNGNNWSAAGSGIDGYVFTLAAHNGEIYAGGNFTNIRKWDGNNWTPLGSAINGSVFFLSVYDGSLIAGGYFDTAGVAAAKNIAKWNGNSWSSIGAGMNGGVSCMIVHNGSLYAGGSFSTAGNVWANRVAKWTEQCASVPAQPGGIIGRESVCIGRSVAYYINPVTDAADFTWTLPPGWQGTSISNRIVILAGTSGGIVSVTANNPCGSSTVQTIAVTVKDTVPSQLDTIVGNKSVCENSIQTYSVTPVPAATNYVWILPAGWTGHSTTNTITVISGTNSGTISVRARNDCSSSYAETLVADVIAAPLPIKDINGNLFVSTGQIENYSISQVVGAGNYTWTLSGGGIILNGQHTSSINIMWQDTGEYILSVIPNNTCISTPEQKITIKVADVSIANSFELKILPNPSSGEFYVKAKRVQDKRIQVEVFNMAGQLVHNSGKRSGTNDYSQLIDIDKLAPGIYAVKIMIDDKVYTKQVLVTN